jgi:hypothetical protein
LKGLVAQLLLLAGHVVHILHGAVHLARHRVGHAAVRSGGLQVLQDVAQLVEEPLGLGHVAALHHLLDLVQHPIQIVLADRAVRAALVRIVLRVLLVALHALGELAQELVHRGAQFLGQALRLLLVGAALQRFAQPLLRGAQLALGLGQIAVLDLNRHGPEPFGNLGEIGVRSCAAQPLGGDAQPHEDAPLRREALGRDQQRIEPDLHPLAVVRDRARACGAARPAPSRAAW